MLAHLKTSETVLHVEENSSLSLCLTRPSALGMSDPVMESLEILGAPEFSNLWRVEVDEGEIDEKVVKKDEKLWTIMKKWWKTVKTMKKYARQ